MPKSFSVTLVRVDATIPQAQFRGIDATSVVKTRLKLSAETEEELPAMIAVAQMDGWKVRGS